LPAMTAARKSSTAGITTLGQDRVHPGLFACRKFIPVLVAGWTRSHVLKDHPNWIPRKHTAIIGRKTTQVKRL